MPPTMTPTPLAQEPLFEFDSTPHPIRDAMMTVPERMALDATTQAKMREAIRVALDDASKAVASAMMPSQAQPVAAGG